MLFKIVLPSEIYFNKIVYCLNNYYIGMIIQNNFESVAQLIDPTYNIQIAKYKLAQTYSGIAINDGLWQQLQLSNKIKSVHQWKVSPGLWLQNNQYSSILRQISHIKFTNLSVLDLMNNNIQSLQLISQLYCPKLTSLNLSKNNIVSLQSIRRCNIQKLTKLQINYNLVDSCRHLSETHWPNLLLFEMTSDETKATYVNYTSLIKWQPSKICMLKVYSFKIKLQKSARKVMLKKYGPIQQ